MMDPSRQPTPSTLPSSAEPLRDSKEPLRDLLLGVLLLGVLGTLAELYLLGHFEEWWQVIPLVLLAGSVPAIVLCRLRPTRLTLRLLQTCMVLLVAGGTLGLYLHYTGNAEFELEMYPGLEGFELFWESLKGATPALAPASIAWLGLIGLVYGYGHPVLRKPTRET